IGVSAHHAQIRAADIIHRYQESHRHYHTSQHIELCLREFQRVRHLFEVPDLAEYALWCHDVVYDTHASDNEEKSAAYMLDSLSRETQYHYDLVRIYAEHILATKHTAVPVSLEARLIVDVDVAVFGHVADIFDW